MNTVQSALQVNDIIGEIRLSLNNQISKNKVWIFVEGIDDTKIYSKFFLQNNVIIRVTEGASYKIPEIITNALAFTQQVIGIKDADFDHLENKNPTTNLFITDYHDIETMMISHDSVLNNTFGEYLSQVDFLQSNSVIAREEVLKQSTYLGYIRWFNYRYDLEILFKGLGVNKFYNGTADFNKENVSEN